MPRGLPLKVKKSIAKSRDAALLAIECYNKPAVHFRSGGYIVLMNIAWTALMHAIFFKRGVKPFYKKNGSNRFEKKDGDFSYWELNTCLQQYFGNDTQNAIRKNLEFFIPLRNIIEHKSLPEIDSDIFAECQAMLINYDTILAKEFGDSHQIRECLSFSLQLFPSAKSLASAVKSNPDAKATVQFIEQYRSTLSADVLRSGAYSFKAFLIQVANHQSKDSLPVQFVRWDDIPEDKKDQVMRVAALVKEKYVEKPIAAQGLLLPSGVIKKVKEKLGDLKNHRGKDKFNPDWHTRCWKKYKIRPDNKSKNPSHTDSKYCVYNALGKNYGYTNDWVNHLIEKMADDDEYSSLYD